MNARPIAAALPAIVVALVPKCPACLGAYLAIASSLGLGKLDPGVLWAVMIAGLVGSLALLGRAAQRRHRWGAFSIACTGAAIVVAGRMAGGGKLVLIAGVALLYAGALKIYLSRLNRTMGCKHAGAACHSK